MHDSNKLGDWKHKVNQLGNEEKHHCFAKVAENSNDGESHACAVTESVPDKNLAWEPVVLKQRKRAQKEGNHDSEWIHVVLHNLLALLVFLSLLISDLNDIVDYNKASNDERLAHFNTIDACVDVNCVRAEDRDVAHIDVVQNS